MNQLSSLCACTVLIAALFLTAVGCSNSGSGQTPDIAAESEPEGCCDALFYGDSITAGGNFADLFPELKIVNMGSNGATLQYLIECVPSVAERDPAKIFVQGGGNDLDSRNLDECVELFRELIEALRKACPNAELFIESMLPMEKAVAYRADCPNRLIRQFNTHLSELAKEYGLTFLDTYSAYELGGELNPDSTTDGVHLKKDAFGPWAQIVRPYLEP